MIHIKRNICLVAVSCTLLAGIPLQGVAQTGRTAKVQATQNHKITVSGTVLDKTTNDPLIGVSVVVKGVANAGTITDMDCSRCKEGTDCLTTGRYESLAGSGCGRLYQTT